MKKLVSSPWFLATLGLILSLAISIAIMFMQVNKILNIDPTKKPPPPNPYEEWSFQSEEIEKLIGELRTEKTRIATQQQEIATEQARIQAERLELERLQKDIEFARQALAKRIESVEKGEQKNLKILAETYSNMAPASTIAIFSEMDDHLIVKILAQMGTDALGPIFEAMANSALQKSGMTPQRAARLSELLRLNQSKQAEQ
tara:strand:- start:6037 stop:6642 length:606 start_codon:yes stop_codon:yes gene_type:complete